MVRGITFFLNSLKCVFCVIDFESKNHLFFNYKRVKIIWNDITLWIGKSVDLQEECLAIFLD